MKRTNGEHISRFVEMLTDEETCWCEFLELRHYNFESAVREFMRAYAFCPAGECWRDS